jgi:hypothetical protein
MGGDVVVCEYSFERITKTDLRRLAALAFVASRAISAALRTRRAQALPARGPNGKTVTISGIMA